MKPNELIQNKCDSSKAGIYMILCLPSGKAVIGSSSKIRRRWIEHRYRLRKGNHGNPYLQNAYNKHGKESLAFLSLENCEVSQLIQREAFYISQVDAEYRMNMAAVTDLIKISDETRRKMSNSKKGIIPWNKGKRNVYSKESLEAMSKAKEGFIPWIVGKKMSEETKLKIFNTKLRKGLIKKKVEV